MSEPRLISPLLDGFVMGDPISNHDGVRSCPAMQLETDKKYIVKIVSLPADQAKMAALILAGAFADRAAAMDYYKELADGVLEETELLQRLSKYEGFVSFEDWQMVPMEDNEEGFDIYLLGEYRPTLENVLRNNEMTHLQAVNMGLDLCTALSVARRNGYLYGNLRPSNVYICNEREFRIGDLGFLSLDSLAFASLPDKYRSDYTPPEINDAFAALNSTMDTYAVGLLLYQAYNDGKLPPVGISMDAPRYADLQLSEIILKACAINPEDRWQDPVQMGQALANYLQSNSVNDIPIVPVPVEEEEVTVEEVPEEDAEPSTEDILAEVDEALEAASPITPALEVTEEVTEPTEEEIIPVADVDALEESAEEITEAEESTQEIAEEESDAVESETESPETEPEEVTPEETSVDETAEMLAQADELIAHQLPEPPVAPEAIEVTLPTPEETPEEENPEEEPAAETAEEESTEEDVPADEDQGEDPEAVEDDDEMPVEAPRKRHKGFIALISVLISFILLATAVIIFCQHYYFQTIHNITLSGTEDQLTVILTTDTADEKLTVRCTDTHGNALTATVKDGIANFSGLKPGTTYKLEVRIEGFHKLRGKLTETYITATQTIIDGFHAVTGKEDGSVILSFSQRGPDSLQWQVHYSTDGEETKTVVFSGHTTPVSGLTVGKEYTFTLEPVTELYLGGTISITHTASNIVYAEELKVLSFSENRLTLSWLAPQNVTVSNWQIRCYNETDYDQTISTTETTAFFDDLDPTSPYTVEVTAEGMTLGSRVYLTANSITIKNVQVDVSDLNNLKLSWEYEGAAPKDGWMILYTIDGGEKQQVATSTETSCTITPLIPCSTYSIEIKPKDGVTYFGGTLDVDVPQAPAFTSFLVSPGNFNFSMCITPDKEGWNRNDVPAKNYTTTFNLGESASFVMSLNKTADKSENAVIALYVIRDADGNLVSHADESRPWNGMWNNRYGKLTIPFMPENPGTYTVEIYFNGAAVTTQSFEIVEA